MFGLFYNGRLTYADFYNILLDFKELCVCVFYSIECNVDLRTDRHTIIIHFICHLLVIAIFIV